MKDQNYSLPKPPRLWQSLGPSFVLLGLALGSGELIMWPYLTANWGFGLIWGGLLGITFQFFLNTEIMRYSLAWGESIFVGFKKLWRWLPVWFIISTFIPWGLPGFSSATGQIIARLLGLTNHTWLSIVLLLAVGLILSAGRVLYKTMEWLQKTVIIVGLPIIFFLVVWFSKTQDWIELAQGLVGKGEGWWFFPPGVSLGAFLGAFAYSGAGGNLNLAQSYYIKEKGFGMGKYGSKITSLVAKNQQPVRLEGNIFSLDQTNRQRWRKWWKLVNQEHALVFWGLGLFTIIMLSYLAKVLVYGQVNSEGIEFLYQQAQLIGQAVAPPIAIVFLGIAAVMLYSTQIGVLESASRIISENWLLVKHKPRQPANASLAFYIALWLQISLGVVIILFGFREPRLLLTVSALLNAGAMMFAFPLVYLLNRNKLPPELQPPLIRILIMTAAFLFFFVFVIYLALWPGR